MDSLRAPLLGPVVGHTTESSCRIWIRADTDQPKEIIGLYVLSQVDTNNQTTVVRSGRFFLAKDWRDINSPQAIDLVDTIGLLDLENLLPETVYRLNVATGLADEWIIDQILMAGANPFSPEQVGLIVGVKAACNFRTFVASTDENYGKALRFVFGSCHYPGHPFQKERSVQAFRSVEAVLKDRRPNFLLMVGDQIYADALGDAAYQLDNAERYRERYTESWAGEWKKKVMAQIPTYMILDDHEIEDNWDNRRLGIPGKEAVFKSAIESYVTYQWCHGPRSFPAFRDLQPIAYPALYYEFSVNGFAVFVMDVRSERSPDTSDANQSELIGNEQLAALRKWLRRNQGPRPKFIVSSVVFTPNAHMNGSHDKDDDGWAAYPRTRAGVLNAIMNDGSPIQNVFLLCGDAHCSSLAKMVITSPGKSIASAYCVTSSPFFAPFTVARRAQSDCVRDSRNENDTFHWLDDHFHVTMDYKVLDFVGGDNFTELDVLWDTETQRGSVEVIRYAEDAVPRSSIIQVTG